MSYAPIPMCSEKHFGFMGASAPHPKKLCEEEAMRRPWESGARSLAQQNQAVSEESIRLLKGTGLEATIINVNPELTDDALDAKAKRDAQRLIERRKRELEELRMKKQAEKQAQTAGDKAIAKANKAARRASIEGIAKPTARKVGTPTATHEASASKAPTHRNGSRSSINVGMQITVVVQGNPCKEGTGHHERFETYKKVKTVGEYYQKHPEHKGDVKYDLDHGFIKLS